MIQFQRVFKGTERRWSHLYLAAIICMIGAAAILRFYELSVNSLWLDEAVAANNARGSFAELIWNTRSRNSSPILYPLILFAIQKWQSTSLTVRLVPALASVLTVVAVLSLLPRFGVDRRVAWLTALMSTVSTAAIMHARDAREYSTDVLLAILLISGLLAFLQANKKTLLGISLFLAPLLQYNLVLLSAAVVGTAAIHLIAKDVCGEHASGKPAHGQSPRLTELIWPLVCFVAGCAITAWVTLRFHWRPGGFASATYLNPYYFLEEFNHLSALVRFLGTRTWQLFDYHLPPTVPIVGIVAIGLHWVGLIARRKVNALVTLCLLALALAIGAALVRIYPLGPIRQCLYLGPVIQLAVAQAFVWLLDYGRPRFLPPWTGPAGLVLATGCVGFAGIVDLLNTDLYADKQPVKDIMAILEDEARAEDLVFVSGGAKPAVQFHRTRELNYHFGTFEQSFEDCFDKVRDLWTTYGPTTLWLVGSHYPVCQGWHFLELLDEHIQVDHLYYHPASQLHRATYSVARSSQESSVRGLTQDPVVTIEDLLHSLQAVYSNRYEVFFYHHKLILAVRQCTRQDYFATVRMEAYSAESQQPTFYGYLNMREYAFRVNERCLAVYTLPKSDLRRIKIYLSHPGQGEVWKAEVDLDTVLQAE